MEDLNEPRFSLIYFTANKATQFIITLKHITVKTSSFYLSAYSNSPRKGKHNKVITIANMAGFIQTPFVFFRQPKSFPRNSICTK